MQTLYIGNTLVNDMFLGSKRMDDIFSSKSDYQIEYLVVAGGGGGAPNVALQPATGGGGAGGLLSGSFTVRKETTYQIKVGAGGTGNGEDSYFTGSGIYNYCFGGGEGGKSGTGVNGGSGGGGGNNGSTNFAGGTGVVGQGTNGDSSTGPNFGGNGGGLAVFSSITGTSIEYAVGGNGGGFGGTTPPVNTGNGGRGASFGGANNFSGARGIVVIRYAGQQRAIGGTVSTDGNFTVHQFTSSGNFTFYSN
jgi:hypothetical protein